MPDRPLVAAQPAAEAVNQGFSSGKHGRKSQMPKGKSQRSSNRKKRRARARIPMKAEGWDYFGV
jgi:hypothetical protein